MSKVSLTKGDSRRKIVFESLKLLGDDIQRAIGEKTVLIKPNFVSAISQKAASHVDQIRGILDFLAGFYKKKIVVAESSAIGKAFDGFKNFGYFQLQEEYSFPFEFIDLDKNDFEEIPILKGESVRVSKTILDPCFFIISAAKLKTHDRVVATLSLKNLAVGMVLMPDKPKIHQGVKEINKNLLLLAKKRIPDLASIDAFYGMEGNGPSRGDMVKCDIAIASLDFLAADRIGLEIMGILPEDVGYLLYCQQEGLGEYSLRKIEIVGEKLENCKFERKFRLHSTIKEQLLWKG